MRIVEEQPQQYNYFYVGFPIFLLLVSFLLYLYDIRWLRHKNTEETKSEESKKED